MLYLRDPVTGQIITVDGDAIVTAWLEDRPLPDGREAADALMDAPPAARRSILGWLGYGTPPYLALFRL